jgi:hypothetical protein
MSKNAALKRQPSGGSVVRDTRNENSLAVSSRRGDRLIHRDARTGSFTSPRSATRIRDTSTRAADSLKRLAKR